MWTKEKNRHHFRVNQLLLSLLLSFLCISIHTIAFAQSFSISFPIGSTVYRESEISLTVIVAGIQCKDIAVKCHKGRISMTDQCQYLYRCKTAGLDTVEVFMRKGKSLQRVGQQVFVVKERPLPEASIGGSKGGAIVKGALKAQQGLAGSYFIAGNHWESCPIESFSFIVLRNNKVVMDFYNEGNFFTQEVKAALEHLEKGDKILVANIKGCLTKGGDMLKSIEFIIE